MRGILYLNQFFAQVGGEEAADFAPELRVGAVGPGLALNAALGDAGAITHTVVCGDNFMGSHPEQAVETILKLLENLEFDVFFAGPAFRAGRYGVACGRICKAVAEKFRVPVYTSMEEENPGVELYRKDLIIFKGGSSAASMRQDVEKLAGYAVRAFRGEPLFWADREGYFGRGIRRQVFPEQPVSAADRAVDMLLARLQGRPFETELPIRLAKQIPPAPAVANLKTAKIALMTTGGIVPVENPDRIQSASATRWGKYDISHLDRLESGVFKTIHAGYDPTEADKNPNVVMPVDAVKALEKEGFFGSLHPYFYSTVGTGTTQSEAQRMAEEIYQELHEAEVSAVLLTST